MKKYLRTIGELLLLGLLAGLLLIAVIMITRQVFNDAKAQYFVIGYYCAMHNDLARWIWKRLGIEKPQETSTAEKSGLAVGVEKTPWTAERVRHRLASKAATAKPRKEQR